MTAEEDHLVDTNVMLRLNRNTDPVHKTIERALQAIVDRGGRIFYCAQTMAEFWNVCTRPVERNGFGMSIGETRRRLE